MFVKKLLGFYKKDFLNSHKIKNIFALKPKDRYGYFLRKVADFRKVFLIVDRNGKFVLIGSDKFEAIPVFPEKEFAKLFLIGDWKKYKVVKYSIDDFFKLLENLSENGILIAGFPNLDLKTVTPTPEEVKNHLLFEIDKYL